MFSRSRMRKPLFLPLLLLLQTSGELSFPPFLSLSPLSLSLHFFFFSSKVLVFCSYFVRIFLWQRRLLSWKPPTFFQKAFGSTTHPKSKTCRDTSMVGGSMCKRTELFCPCPQEAEFEIEAFLGGCGQVAKIQEIEFGMLG